MPVVRVDDQVYRWLASQIRDFGDTPNTVLRRVSSLDGQEQQASKVVAAVHSGEVNRARKFKTGNGRALSRKAGLVARQSFYHHEGTWFQPITTFPVVLWDKGGYVLFNNAAHLGSYEDVRVTQKTNVPKGIANLPPYRKWPDS